MSKKIIVIGAGPGGYTAAFMAADLGMDVTLVHEYEKLGGTCLHAGCIPAKTLLHTSRILNYAKEASHYGITFDPPKIDITSLRDKKNDVISKLSNGLAFLCKQKKVKFIQGKASFKDSNDILVTKTDGSTEEVKFEKAIIATGSKAITLTDIPDSQLIMDSTNALDIENIPALLLIVGGGYIGVELGSIYAALGSEVTIVELTEQLLPGTDADLVKVFKSKAKQTFKAIKINTKVTKLQESTNKITATLEDKTGTTEEAEFDKVLIAIGRKPRTFDLELKNTRVTLDDKGYITVNSQRQTSNPNIYAIGDVTYGPMLAHKASYEAKVAINAIEGKESSFENKIIPAVVFTDPEIAYCGLSDQEAKDKNIDVKTSKFNWAASGRALTHSRADGFTKLVIDKNTDKILGVSIVGIGASELIAEGVIAIENDLKVSDLTKCIHPHPTLSETIYEAGELFYK